MAGIYIHIPFCKKACAYCNFYFSTSQKNKVDFIHALKNEIIIRKAYLGNDTVNTIYFGGGTPSLLQISEVEDILNTIGKHFNLDVKEITFEMNPDDVDFEMLKALKLLGINRISLGVQSFFDDDLAYLRRVHSSNQAKGALTSIVKAGFTNYTIDLIYGIPQCDESNFAENLKILADYQVPHFSAYALTIEPKTLLNHQIKKGKVKSPVDEKYLEDYFKLVDFAEENGFIHYEISNFAKTEDLIAIHNSAYWKDKKYIGLGPSAHSYNGTSRQWNISNNSKYITQLLNNHLIFESEKLAKNDFFNEYIMTSLRTMWGANKEKIKKDFGSEFLKYFYEKLKDSEIEERWINESQESIYLTKEGRLFADKIISQLFIIDQI